MSSTSPTVHFSAKVFLITKTGRTWSSAKERSGFSYYHFAKSSESPVLESTVMFRGKLGERKLGPVAYDDEVSLRCPTTSKAGARFLVPDSRRYLRWFKDCDNAAGDRTNTHVFRVVAPIVSADSVAVDLSRAGLNLRDGSEVLLQSVASDDYFAMEDKSGFLRLQDKITEASVFRLRVLPDEELSAMVAAKRVLNSHLPDVLFEYQRYYVRRRGDSQWNTPGRDGHKSDPSHFADSSGKAPYGSPDLCDEHGDFVVDRTGECDSEGWSYGASFEELCEPDQDEGETKGAEVTRRDSSAASVMSLGSIRTSRLPTVDEDDGDAEELKRTRMRRRRWLRRGSVAEQRTRERATEDAKQQLPAATPASPAALGGDLFGGILDALRAHRQHGISVRMENVDDKTVACVTGDTLLGFILEKGFVGATSLLAANTLANRMLREGHIARMGGSDASDKVEATGLYYVPATRRVVPASTLAAVAAVTGAPAWECTGCFATNTRPDPMHLTATPTTVIKIDTAGRKLVLHLPPGAPAGRREVVIPFDSIACVRSVWDMDLVTSGSDDWAPCLHLRSKVAEEEEEAVEKQRELIKMAQNPWRWVRVDVTDASGAAGGAQDTWYLSPPDFLRSAMFGTVATGDAIFEAAGKLAGTRSEFDQCKQLLVDSVPSSAAMQDALRQQAAAVKRLVADMLALRCEWVPVDFATATGQRVSSEDSIQQEIIPLLRAVLDEVEAVQAATPGVEWAEAFRRRVHEHGESVAKEQNEVLELLEEGRRLLDSETAKLQESVEHMRVAAEEQRKLTALYGQPVFPVDPNPPDAAAAARRANSLRSHMSKLLSQAPGGAGVAMLMMGAGGTEGMMDSLIGHNSAAGAEEEKADAATEADGAKGGAAGAAKTRAQEVVIEMPERGGAQAGAEGAAPAEAGKPLGETPDLEAGAAGTEEESEEAAEERRLRKEYPEMAENHRPFVKALLVSVVLNIGLLVAHRMMA